MSKTLDLLIKGDLFKSAEQPEDMDALPEDFSEAETLLKESKSNIGAVSTLLGCYIDATFDPKKVPNASKFIANTSQINATSIEITAAKFSKKTPIPKTTLTAIFKLEVKDDVTHDKLMTVLSDWFEAANFKWNIDFWGVEGLNLEMKDPDQRYVVIESLV